jgi:hypothetical protein
MHTQGTRIVQAGLSGSSILALSMAVALSGNAIPANAHAGSAPLAKCSGQHNASWSPGETNTSQPITVTTDTVWECKQPSGDAITATSDENFKGQFNCASNSEAQPAITWTIRWNDGEQSTFVFNAVVDAVNGNLNINAPGTITQGKFAGSKATATFTLNNFAAELNTLCNTASGVTSATGTSTLTISSPGSW